MISVTIRTQCATFLQREADIVKLNMVYFTSFSEHVGSHFPQHRQYAPPPQVWLELSAVEPLLMYSEFGMTKQCYQHGFKVGSLSRITKLLHKTKKIPEFHNQNRNQSAARFVVFVFPPHPRKREPVVRVESLQLSLGSLCENLFLKFSSTLISFQITRIS